MINVVKSNVCKIQLKREIIMDSIRFIYACNQLTFLEAVDIEGSDPLETQSSPTSSQ